MERRIHWAYRNDGSLDILIGLVLLAIGTGRQMDLVPLTSITPALAIPVWIGLRKYLVEPGIILICSGVLTDLAGKVLLTRFLKEFPRIDPTGE